MPVLITVCFVEQDMFLFRRSVFFCVCGSRVLKACGHVRQLALFWDLHGWRFRTISAGFCDFYERCSRLQGTKTAYLPFGSVATYLWTGFSWLGIALWTWLWNAMTSLKAGTFLTRLSTVSFSNRCQLCSIMNQIAFFCILLLQGASFVITKHHCVFRT